MVKKLLKAFTSSISLNSDENKILQNNAWSAQCEPLIKRYFVLKKSPDSKIFCAKTGPISQ